MGEAKASILIVDDEESFRNILSRKFTLEGYCCATAANGDEALEAMSVQKFDLVLLDIRMPGIAGMEVLRQIIADHRDTPVVMLTAVPDQKTAIEAMKLGAYDYVTKSFGMSDLSIKVENALKTTNVMSGKT